MSVQSNLGWVFYRKAFEIPDKNWFVNEYKDLGNSDADKQEGFTANILDELTEQPKFTDEETWNRLVEPLIPPGCNKTFELVTTYPGLLTGSGYNHEAGLFGELKLGFFFDHTTGLPVIPGSSVKGALRSVFPNSSKKEKEEVKQEKRKFLIWLMKEVNSKIDAANAGDLKADTLKIEEVNNIDVGALEYEIFEGAHRNLTTKMFEADTSMYKRDIFYDACILRSDYTRPNGTRGHFLGNDYITPHRHREQNKAYLDPFANPTPIQFLKILPGVAFKFQFCLQDGILSGKQKLLLFREILLTLGIGAKTNVGYGQFTEAP